MQKEYQSDYFLKLTTNCHNFYIRQNISRIRELK